MLNSHEYSYFDFIIEIKERLNLIIRQVKLTDFEQNVRSFSSDNVMLRNFIILLV
jgi:hypothetical protein